MSFKPPAPKPNPFKAKVVNINEDLDFDEAFENVVTDVALKTSNAFTTESTTAVESTVKITEKEDFLMSLRDFMNDFAESDLNINSIEEPGKMNSSQANFYVKLCRQAIEERDKAVALCDEEIKRITDSVNAYKEARVAEYNKQIEYFESILKQFLIVETEGKKSKTVKLPYGTLSIRNVPPKFVYNNEEAIVDFLTSEKPELINTKITKSINKSTLKKEGVIKDKELYLNGVKVPDVIIEEQEPKFEVKLPK